jgi:hypothetical protein
MAFIHTRHRQIVKVFENDNSLALNKVRECSTAYILKFQ